MADEKNDPPAGDPPTPPEKAPAQEPQRKLVGIAKMGPHVFRMDWTNESGDHQVNHVHRGSLEQILDNFGEIPDGLPDEARRHRENLISEARWKLTQLPGPSWELKDLKAFAKRAGIEIPKDGDVPALLAAIYY